VSNNVAEYEALVHGLKLAKEIGIRRILCFGDSDLVVHQVSGQWDVKDANMASYRFYVQQLCGFFEGCEFHHVPRENNDEADQLSKIGSTKQDIPAGVSLEIIYKPSIKPSPEGHADVAVHTTRHDEGGLLFVLLCHLDLIIAGESIQEAKEVTAGGGVDDLIYPWERIRVLGTSLVETCEVHAEAPTAIRLWDDHRIGNPGGVGYLAY
jgi:hypothetical protein